MRMVMFLATVAAAALTGVGPSRADYEPPWCLQANKGSGWVSVMCYYRTFERCRDDMFLYGTTSFCIHNPRSPYWAEPSGPKRRKSQREPR
jgi:hypothetical protein